MTEGGGGLGHLGDGAAPVGPVRMTVTVPLQQGPDPLRLGSEGHARVVLELPEVSGGRPGQGFLDDSGRGIADPGDLAQPSGRRQGPERLRVEIRQ